MKTLLCLLLILSSISLSASPFCLKQKFEQGKEGDYIVAEQDNHFSILILRSLANSRLVLEEISIPSSSFESLSIPSFRQWVEKGAIGSSSWTLFEINLETGRLQEAYSHSHRHWLSWEDAEPFLTALLSLPLKKLPSEERKKIGAAPLSNESDHRAIWNPPLICEGKKTVKPQFEVWRTFWPEDSSRLSKAQIDLYFDAQKSSFPFPLWMEVFNGHYCFKIPIIDSGNTLHSSFKGPMPHRLPVFLGPPLDKGDFLLFYVKSPPYYTNFHLFALDLTTGSHQPISLPCEMIKTNESNAVVLQVAKKDLKPLLELDHSYRWALVPTTFSNIYAESSETWVWKE